MAELSKLNVPEIDFTESRLEPASLQKLLLNPNLKKITCNFCRKLRDDDMDKFMADYKSKWRREVKAIKLDFDQADLKNMKTKPFEVDIE